MIGGIDFQVKMLARQIGAVVSVNRQQAITLINIFIGKSLEVYISENL